MKKSNHRHGRKRAKSQRDSAIKHTDRSRLASIARLAMLERGLEPEFPPAAQAELEHIHAPAAATAAMSDLRDLLWASIDNDDSRDLDQLTVAESLADGRTRILVAIADVDALVNKNSALDDHAARNTTSVYTPGVIFPMLPLALSTNLTSMNEDQDRVAIVTDMVFETDGALVESKIYRALVRNRAKLTYRGLAAWQDGQGPAPARLLDIPGLDDNLRVQDALAQKLAGRRHRVGALSLASIEPRAVFDGDRLADLDLDEKNRAQQLIEDFMIATNGATATYLASKNFPSLRRVLRSPERWERIVMFAAQFEESLPDEPDAVALEAFLMRRRQADPVKFPDVSLTVIKLMGRGEYALAPPGGAMPGHFGLAVKDYTHSTAPNRRFPDLITQRLLKAAIGGAARPYTLAELEHLARHCTQREDDATKVERRMRKSAAALLLTDRIGETFDSIVTGAGDKGTWVRLLRPPVEGRVERGYKGLDVGDRVRVKLIHTDVERGFIDFARD